MSAIHPLTRKRQIKPADPTISATEIALECFRELTKKTHDFFSPWEATDVGFEFLVIFQTLLTHRGVSPTPYVCDYLDGKEKIKAYYLGVEDTLFAPIQQLYPQSMNLSLAHALGMDFAHYPFELPSQNLLQHIAWAFPELERREGEDRAEALLDALGYLEV